VQIAFRAERLVDEAPYRFCAGRGLEVGLLNSEIVERGELVVMHSNADGSSSPRRSSPALFGLPFGLTVHDFMLAEKCRTAEALERLEGPRYHSA
jgi:hypothetical protein